MRIQHAVVTLGLASAIVMAARADQWPQWRGPQRNGISQETGLLKQWPADGPKLLWHAKQIGSGYSTPAVVGDYLYLLSNEGNENEYVQALRQRWHTSLVDSDRQRGQSGPATVVSRGPFHADRGRRVAVRAGFGR